MGARDEDDRAEEGFIAREHADQVSDGALDPLSIVLVLPPIGIREDLLALAQAAHSVLVDRKEQCVLGGGAGVQGSRWDLCAFTESRDRERLVAALLQQSYTSVEDAVPLLTGAL